jgi:hypothetical protein
MHTDDYDVLAGAIAAEHRDPGAGPGRRHRRQVEHIALTIARALADNYPLFDPVKFMLAACNATTLEQLSAPIRRQVADRFGTSEPRRRASSYSDVPLDPGEASRWTAETLIGAAIPRTTQAGNMAIGTLNWEGIHTLGQLAEKTDGELQAIPRIGPGAMRVIREVLDLWRARQHPSAAGGRTPASADAPQSNFPVANPLTASAPGTGVPRRAPAALASRPQATRRVP